ncbi:hypothetical protein ACLKA6_007325 [Drosophila palustris]
MLPLSLLIEMTSSELSATTTNELMDMDEGGLTKSDSSDNGGGENEDRLECTDRCDCDPFLRGSDKLFDEKNCGGRANNVSITADELKDRTSSSSHEHQSANATKTNQQDPFWVDPGVPTLPEAEKLIASLMLASRPDWPISACPGIISFSGTRVIGKQQQKRDKTAEEQ